MHKILLNDLESNWTADGASGAAPAVRRAGLMITCLPDCCPTEKLADHLADDHWLILRTPAGIVVPYGAGDSEFAEIIDRAIHANGIAAITVCACSGCALAKRLLAAEPARLPRNLDAWRPFAEAARQVAAADPSGRPAIEHLILSQAANLATHPSVAVTLAGGSLRVNTWLFDPIRDELLFPDSRTRAFSRPAALSPSQNAGLKPSFVRRLRQPPREPVFDLRRVELA